jgi:hypothetical protein
MSRVAFCTGCRALQNRAGPGEGTGKPPRRARFPAPPVGPIVFRGARFLIAVGRNLIEASRVGVGLGSPRGGEPGLKPTALATTVPHRLSRHHGTGSMAGGWETDPPRGEGDPLPSESDALRLESARGISVSGKANRGGQCHEWQGHINDQGDVDHRGCESRGLTRFTALFIEAGT